MFMKNVSTLIILLSFALHGYSQTLYDINTIQKIEITFTQSNWDFQLDTAKAGAEGYIMAKSVAINGIKYDSVGVKYKGNSTYNANQTKNPFHIELDTYKNQDYQGYTDIKLSNAAKDPSFIREVLSYDILRQYMDAPLSNYANVFVNGALIGLYSSSESISKKFVNNHFYSKTNSFIKCNPNREDGSTGLVRPNLVYLGTDSSLYQNIYDIKSDYGWKQFIALCDTLRSNIGGIENILDVDRALWMLAFNNVFVNLDSYIGLFAQNYYLYQDDNGRFNSVVWDLNQSFGSFGNTGTSNLPNTASKQQMSHILHLNDTAWPLVQKLLSNPRYRRMYVAHMKTMLQENFTNGTYLTKASNLQTIINNAVNTDPNKFYTYTQYLNGLTVDIPEGMTLIPGIKTLMDGRTTYLSNQADFTAVAPTISNISVSNTSPILNSKVTITAKVTNSTEVFLGYRFSKTKQFVKTIMYDDGLHNDGSAGDLIFGAEISMEGSFAEYYFYADNANAGIFSPQRAEHEFYSLFAAISNIIKGELVINELMADNATTVTDANGQYDDWIELYNNTSTTLNLTNLFLSDSYTTPQKWKFPDGTLIGPKSYLIIWADEDLNQAGLHAAFKLSASGEKTILSYADGYVVDSISFGVQTKDVSFLRCPNGTGNFKLHAPSFAKENCLTVSSDDKIGSNLAIYPNPSTGLFYIENKNAWVDDIKIFQVTGNQILHMKSPQNPIVEINVQDFQPGIYFVKINNSITKKIILH